MAVPTLLITGPVGVGKTAVAGEVSRLLERSGVPHAMVDVDALSQCFPRLALRNLAAVWSNCRAAGARRLILARVIESRADLGGYRSAVPGARIVVCRLRAPARTLASRIRRREPGAGRAWHLARARELAPLMERAAVEDFVVETAGRSLTVVARDVLGRAGWPRGVGEQALRSRRAGAGGQGGERTRTLTARSNRRRGCPP